MDTSRGLLTNAEWDRISAFTVQKAGKPSKTTRQFIDGVLWIARTGAPWRDLPLRFGNWAMVYQRFNHWSKKDRFKSIFEALQKPDMEEIQIDSTAVRAHKSAHGAKKK